MLFHFMHHVNIKSLGMMIMLYLHKLEWQEARRRDLISDLLSGPSRNAVPTRELLYPTSPHQITPTTHLPPPAMPPANCRLPALSLRSLRIPTTAAPLHRRVPLRQPTRTISSTPKRALSSIPYIPTCPPSTCTCVPTPPDLDIDHKTPLLNTMASYAQHVVVCSGKPDWASRIEDEQSSAGDFVRGLKSVIGRGGARFDVRWYVPS